MFYNTMSVIVIYVWVFFVMVKQKKCVLLTSSRIIDRTSSATRQLQAMLH